MNTKSWDDLAELDKERAELNNNLLLIDGNNIGYRYLKRSNYNDYYDEYIRTVDSLSKSYNARTTIVCFDFGKSYFRIDMFPEYKAGRKKPETEEEQKHYDDFFEVLNNLPERLGDRSWKFRGVEADDLITYAVKHMKQEYDHTWIVSSDKDMLQLLDTNVSIFNMFSRKEIDITTLADLGITSEEYLLSRIIEGDKSDNIIGIEGIGPKRAQDLAKKYKTLKEVIMALPIKSKSKYIQNLNAGKDTLLRNEVLMSLEKYNNQALEAGENKDILETLQKCVINFVS